MWNSVSVFVMKFILFFVLAITSLSAIPRGFDTVKTKEINAPQHTYTVKEGKLVPTQKLGLLSPQEHYSLILNAAEKEDWKEVQKQALIVIENFPNTHFHQEAFFYLGSAYFHQKEYELASKQISIYLKKHSALQHFQEAIDLKFQIAEQFKDGAKKHLMGWDALPKWLPASSEALKLYEEVISALPNDHIAAKALYGKASIEMLDEEFEKAIESYTSLIRRFPQHPLTPEAYVQIGKIYLTECQEKYPDTNFLDLAQINLRKFEQEFSTDERVEAARKMVEEMKEVYANSFYEIAQFFERTKKTNASLIYYTKIIKHYPNTKSAELSQHRLNVLRPSSHETPSEQNIAQENKTVVPSL